MTKKYYSAIFCIAFMPAVYAMQTTAPTRSLWTQITRPIIALKHALINALTPPAAPRITGKTLNRALDEQNVSQEAFNRFKVTRCGILALITGLATHKLLSRTTKWLLRHRQIKTISRPIKYLQLGCSCCFGALAAALGSRFAHYHNNTLLRDRKQQILRNARQYFDPALDPNLTAGDIMTALREQVDFRENQMLVTLDRNAQYVYQRLKELDGTVDSLLREEEIRRAYDSDHMSFLSPYRQAKAIRNNLAWYNGRRAFQNPDTIRDDLINVIDQEELGKA